LSEEASARVDAFVAARNAFARVLGAGHPAAIDPPDNLGSDAFGMILTLHMAALAMVDAHVRQTASPTDPAGLSSYLLGRERQYWQQLHTLPAGDPARIPTSPQIMGRTAFIATLTRPVVYDD